MATDYLVMPVRCETLAIDGLVESMAHKEAFDPYRAKVGLNEVELLGIVPNMHRQGTVEHSENLLILQEHFGSVVWEPIPLGIVWAEATGQRRTVFSIAPNSKAAGIMWRIVERVEAVHVEA
ncbi:MAG: ParA family protein [Chloroflexi bacterium]|nr:ParA family protein [Chloroflexota bacterium]